MDNRSDKEIIQDIQDIVDEPIVSRPQASMSEYRRMGHQAPYMLVERIQTLESMVKGLLEELKGKDAYAARNASLQHELRATQDAAGILSVEVEELKRTNNRLDASFTRAHNTSVTFQADVESLLSANRDLKHQRDYALTELKQTKARILHLEAIVEQYHKMIPKR